MIVPTYILGIESSCDDTSASVLCDGKVLSNLIANQEIHKSFGGVVPELASRAHQQNIIPVVNQAILNANIDKNQLNAIAYTRGPGLLGSLLVGSSFSKSLSMGLNVPLIEVNHMQAHLLAHFIEDCGDEKTTFPFIGVTISGGHTQIVFVKNYFDMEIIGETLDDAIGETFDKCGKMLGLPYPAGPHIDKHSKVGNPNKFKFTKPRVGGLNYSFSGLKTGFMRYIQKEKNNNNNFISIELDNLCASLQLTIVEILYEKIILAIKQTGINRVVFGGGVSCNSGIIKKFKQNENIENYKSYFPKFEYTTDNAAMIAMVGYLKYKNNDFSSIEKSAQARFKF
ncbi:MAG: tRNA (adenosine(37)-N6)-threonylcarbamoyltransferase complex transferase subunit TsaD [Flavobacteriales bacterium]|nr:tRNA (adenosine(37)-N6)-threonylcarbamoyltransferase complex transferase subunit TsaD [Flavobacteriales bacterium]